MIRGRQHHSRAVTSERKQAGASREAGWARLGRLPGGRPACCAACAGSWQGHQGVACSGFCCCCRCCGGWRACMGWCFCACGGSCRPCPWACTLRAVSGRQPCRPADAGQPSTASQGPWTMMGNTNPKGCCLLGGLSWTAGCGPPGAGQRRTPAPSLHRLGVAPGHVLAGGQGLLPGGRPVAGGAGAVQWQAVCALRAGLASARPPLRWPLSLSWGSECFEELTGAWCLSREGGFACSKSPHAQPAASTCSSACGMTLQTAPAGSAARGRRCGSGSRSPGRPARCAYPPARTPCRAP